MKEEKQNETQYRFLQFYIIYKCVLQGIKDELGKGKSKLDVNFYESQCTYEELLGMAHDLRKGDMEHDDKVVQEFILVLMKEWGQELNDKDSISKMSVKGRMEATTYAQTR